MVHAVLDIRQQVEEANELRVFGAFLVNVGGEDENHDAFRAEVKCELYPIKVYSLWGDEDADPGARNAERPATIAAAGVAAYTGSLLSTMNALSDNPVLARRHGGIMLAVRLTGQNTEERVIRDLEQQGALDVEKAQGEWRDGQWVDFSPVSRPRLVAEESATDR